MIFWMTGFMMLGGVAVDLSNALRTHNHLQIAADSAAHAAVVELHQSGYDEDVARAKALEIAADNMPVSQHGDVVDSSEVQLGNFSAGVFTDGALPLNAARVVARRETSRGNALRASLLQLVGLESWNLNSEAIARVDPPPCYRQGLVAMGEVEIASNNHFGGEICVAGILGVSIQNNNVWEPGTIVATPDLTNLRVPNYSLNDGLPAAIRERAMYPKFVSALREILPQFGDPDFALQPAFIDRGVNSIVLAKSQFRAEDLMEGRVYEILCGSRGNNTLTLNGHFEKVGIFTDCKLSLANNATFSDVVLATTSNDDDSTARSVSIGRGVMLGAPDGCSDGGGAWIFAYGEVHAPAQVTLNGAMIVTEGDVHISANTDGIMGTAVLSGGDIKVTSNEAFALCEGGSSNPEIYQFSVVK